METQNQMKKMRSKTNLAALVLGAAFALNGCGKGKTSEEPLINTLPVVVCVNTQVGKRVLGNLAIVDEDGDRNVDYITNCYSGNPADILFIKKGYKPRSDYMLRNMGLSNPNNYEIMTEEMQIAGNEILQNQDRMTNAIGVAYARAKRK